MSANAHNQHNQHYRLKWNSFHTNLSDIFQNMLVQENLVDCTVACEGASIKAHKMILAASSPYFQNLFVSNPCKHPIVILKDVRFADLKSVIDFIYRGEVNVPQDQLSSLLKTAETLRIKGLAEVGDKHSRSNPMIESIQLRHKKRKRKRNKSQNQQNNENTGESSEEEVEMVSSNSRFENNLFNYSANYRMNTHRHNVSQKSVPNIDTITVNKDKETTLRLDDIEPTNLLEQSMSTPENTCVEYPNDGSFMAPEVRLDLDEDEDNDLQEISLVDDNYGPNFNQFNDSSFDALSQIGSNSNHSTPQTIEEYEQLLAEIQRKNLTTCPVCAKVFIKKSKLVRHYHTHFSNFRPKFSCGSCGKLFTTQDWCKRHAINCQSKVSQIGFA